MADKFLNIEDIVVSSEEEQKIKQNSPLQMPLNPTTQGWSGSAVRAMLANFVVGDSDSVINTLKSKLTIVKDLFDDTKEEVTYSQSQINEIFIALDSMNVDSYSCVAGEDLTRGDLVMRNGAVNGSPNVVKADSQGFNDDPGLILGFAYSDATSGSTLIVKTNGILRDIDTSTFDVDDVLYADVINKGQLTNVRPTTGLPVQVGICIVTDDTHGAVYIKEVVLGGLQEIPMQPSEPGADYTGDYWFKIESDPEPGVPLDHDSDSFGADFPSVSYDGDTFIKTS